MSKNKKNIKIFLVIFLQLKINLCILHGQVFVMRVGYFLGVKGGTVIVSNKAVDGALRDEFRHVSTKSVFSKFLKCNLYSSCKRRWFFKDH